MTNMSKDEKRMMLFDMQEHPEKYTDEQVEHLLADEEVKEFFHELAMARMAGKKANPKDVDVDGAWKEFVQAHHEDKMSIDAGKSKERLSQPDEDCCIHRWHHLPFGGSLGCDSQWLVGVPGF